MTILFNNDAYSTLAAAITTTGQTSVTVQTGHGDRFPVVASPDVAYVTLKSAGGTVEIVKITARALGSDVFTVVRGQEGTTAVTWSIGDVVSMRITAHSLNSFGTNNWELVSVGGSANAITATAPAKVTAYTTNHIFRGIAAYTNTGPTTINLTPFGGAAIGAKSIYKGSGLELDPGDIQAGSAFFVMYDGTRMQLVRGALDLNSAQTALTAYLLPSMSDGWRGIYRAGFDWWSRNQQWGGPFGFMGLVDGATGTAYSGEAATGNIEVVSGSAAPQFDNASETWGFNGFKVAETQPLTAIWIKLYKTGNPTGNLQLYILPDDGTGTKPTGTTPITNGTATAQSGKLHTSDTNGQWYRFVFPAPPTLTGGTQYHFVVKSSAAVDASNYWNLCRATNKKYPFGNYGFGDATPTWTASATNCITFIAELSSTAQILQGSGQFDGKLQFAPVTASGVLTMGRALNSSVDIGELIDPHEFTVRIAMKTAPAKDETIWDTGYGQDHDRFVLRCAATTGYATLTRYDSSGTATTVTDNYDLSSAGPHDVWIYSRNKGDGSDALKLYRAGAAAGTPLTGQTITLDPLFLNGQVGTMWVGGGFALAPTWSGSSIGINGFSGLPSTLGWTYAGAATEANAYSVSGGKLFQNKNGYTALQDGYYRKPTAGLSNANGWAFNQKYRLVSGTNASEDQQFMVDILDGTKRHLTIRGEYFCQRWDAGYSNVVQRDNTSVENSDLIIGKGSDVYEFYNNRLVLDGTAAMGSATATNEIDFGDASATSGCNADATISYAKYYTTAWLPPQFTTASIDELAIWSGDRTSLVAPLYNSGTLISVKQFCGLPMNYLDKSGKLEKQEVIGITSLPTTTSGSIVDADEMGIFVVGEVLDMAFSHSSKTGTAGTTIYATPHIDGIATRSSGDVEFAQTPANNYNLSLSSRSKKKSYLGLHKISGGWATDAGTLTNQYRTLQVEAKV